MIKLACGGMGGTRKAQDNTGSYSCRIRCIPIQGMLQGACWEIQTWQPEAMTLSTLEWKTTGEMEVCFY